LNDSDKNFKGDGRLTVLLFLMTGLLLFDFLQWYQWPFFNRTNGANSNNQLSFVPPDKLVVENCSNAGMKQRYNYVPAIVTPFFFELIPINRADKEILMSVKGIGPALANDIVEYREQFGPIKTSADLQKIKGIGPKRAAKFLTIFTFTEVP
jgi:competence ComEA-like helix-hairpin-helix protein